MSSHLTSLKKTVQKYVAHCYSTVCNMADKNNPLQWFSSFQESVLLYLLNTRSYENRRSSLTVKDIFDL